MSRDGHARLYRTLTTLYPRTFRREYGEDLVQSFRDELHDRGAIRGWARVLGDLVQTIPVQHLEVRMNTHDPSRRARWSLGAVAMAVLAVIAIGRAVIILVPVVLLVGVVALLRWRSQVPYRDAISDGTVHWWKLLVAGAALFLSIGAADNYGPNDISVPWTVAVFLFLSAVSLLMLGALLGLVHLTKRLRRRPAV